MVGRLVNALLYWLSSRRGNASDDGTATIVEKRLTQAEYRDEGNRYEYVVDVEVPGQPAFRTTMRDPTAVKDYFPPRPGQRVRVMVDVKRQKAKFDRSDPGLDPRNALTSRLKKLAAFAQGRVPSVYMSWSSRRSWMGPRSSTVAGAVRSASRLTRASSGDPDLDRIDKQLAGP